MNIRPLQDRVLVEPDNEETTSPAGILLPDTATEKPARGTIVAVGNGKLADNGKYRPLDVQIGDKVLYGKYAGTEVKVGEDKFLMMREEDIMGVVED